MTTLFHRSVRATGWALVGAWTVSLLGFSAMIVLARVLTPADFGVLAVATSYLALAQGLSTLNVGQALIKLRNDSRVMFDTAWTLSTARGLILTLLLAMSSPMVARFVDDARVSSVVLVIGLVPLVSGLANPRFVVFERDIDFSRMAIVDVATKILAVGVTIVVALTLRTYWAVVIGTVVGTLARTGLTFVMKPYCPRICLVGTRSILGFSGWLSLANGLNTLSTTLDNLIIARFLGIGETGFYNMTRQVAALPNDVFLGPVERVLFATFSTIAHDARRLASRVLEVIGLVACIAIPSTIGLALIASEFILLVLGEQWLPCVPYLQVILPFFAFRTVVTSATPAAMAAGATRQISSNALYFATLRLPIFVGFVAYHGLIGAIYALCVVAVIWWILNFQLLKTAVSITLRELVAAVHRQMISATVMAGSVLGIPLLLADPSPSWGLLVLKVGVGVTTYTVAQVTLWLIEGRPIGAERRIIDLWQGLKITFAARS